MIELANFEVFIYDTEAVRSEYDDPVIAVLFRFPLDLTDDQVVCTAGQLAGMARFFTDTLGENPTFFQMNRGRYEVERIGRFLAFVGDMTVTTILLDESALRLKTFLLDQVRFFFGDLVQWHQGFELRRRKKATVCPTFGGEMAAFFRLIFAHVNALERITLTSDDACQRLSRSCQKCVSDHHFEGCSVTSDVDIGFGFSSFSEEITQHLSLFQKDESLFEGVQYTPSFIQPLGVKIYTFGTAREEINLEEETHVLENEANCSPQISHSESDDLTDYEYHLWGAATDSKSARRRSRSSRKETIRKAKSQKENEKTHFLDTMRKIVQVTRSSRADVISLNEQFILFVQTFGCLELLVGFRSRTVHEGTIRALWDAGLAHLPKVFERIVQKQTPH